MFLCSSRVMLSRKGRKSQVWNQINQQKISTRKYLKYFFPSLLLACTPEISLQVIISNVCFTGMRNFILSCFLNIQSVPTWNLTPSIRYSAFADAALQCLNCLLLQGVIKTQCRGVNESRGGDDSFCGWMFDEERAGQDFEAAGGQCWPLSSAPGVWSLWGRWDLQSEDPKWFVLESWNLDCLWSWHFTYTSGTALKASGLLLVFPWALSFLVLDSLTPGVIH